jgi:glycosyltransferase involved in cell wall biosynthesis
VRHYAVIPTHNRPTELAELLRSIPPDVHVLVIDNASEPPVQFSLPLEFLGRRLEIRRDEEQPPNLSRLWNIGLVWADRLEEYCADVLPEYAGEHAVTVLNDDVVLPPEFFDLMGSALTATGTDVAFPCPLGQPDFYINRERPFPGLGLRMTGWCFTVRGSSGLQADERLRWWCGDDDLQASAVRHGRGTVGVFFEPGSGPKHRYPDQSTVGVLREQTDKDMATFVKKWGQRPW